MAVVTAAAAAVDCGGDGGGRVEFDGLKKQRVVGKK
jgi:hypothetical protein